MTKKQQKEKIHNILKTINALKNNLSTKINYDVARILFLNDYVLFEHATKKLAELINNVFYIDRITKIQLTCNLTKNLKNKTGNIEFEEPPNSDKIKFKKREMGKIITDLYSKNNANTTHQELLKLLKERCYITQKTFEHHNNTRSNLVHSIGPVSEEKMKILLNKKVRDDCLNLNNFIMSYCTKQKNFIKKNFYLKENAKYTLKKNLHEKLNTKVHKIRKVKKIL